MRSPTFALIIPAFVSTLTRRIKHQIVSGSILSLILLQTACDSRDPMRDAQQRLNAAYESARESIPQNSEEVKMLTDEELQKLRSIEYHVSELSPPPNGQQLQDHLQMLGKQNWNCFDVTWRTDAVYVTCKKEPASWFRFMQRFVP